MHRYVGGGKRIRMDDGPPTDYEPPPMTPYNDDTEPPDTPYNANTNEPQGMDCIEQAQQEDHEAAASLPMETDSPADVLQHHHDLQQQQREQSPASMASAAPDSPLTDPVSENAPQHYEPIPPITISMTRRGRGRSAVIKRPVDHTGDVLSTAAATVPPPAKRGRGRGRGRPPLSHIAHHQRAMRQQQQQQQQQQQEETSLYTIVRDGRSSLQVVVDDWVDEYKTNRNAALLALNQFFITASGCKGIITTNMQQTMEDVAIIRKMTEEFDEESGEYPLIQSGQSWKKFRCNFCDFVSTLVKQCQYSIIYDQHLMDNVISFLTGLTDSQVRAFRHTATLAAMKLMTALVNVALTVSINMDNTQRQYEAERQKSRDKRASDRLEALLTKRQELEENMDEIKNMLTYMFKSVFVHRYRDTLPEIRSVCMAEIGIWMKKFHQNFLDDSYLKYIGWTLHDKVGDVRLKCLQALQPLYSSEELKGKLELFTSKFKDRIVAMTMDKEFDVAVQAVKLVISILKYHRDILSDKDCEHVYELVYSSHRAVAQAAGEFLNERLFIADDTATELTDAQRSQRGKRRLPNTPLIRDLVQFFIESELHEHGAYLVDSLIESNPMIKDWECMTDLLIEEPGPMEEALDDKQENSLIEIMVCAVRQSACGEPPVGRGPLRKVLSAREVKQVSDDRVRLTEHFIATLPSLLAKYAADPEKVANLVSIPQYFDLDIYTTSRQEKNLDALLALCEKVVERHTDTDVLNACAKSLELLCADNHAIRSRCLVARDTLIDAVVARYREAVDEYTSLIAGSEEPNEDEIFSLVSSVKKVAILSTYHNLAPWNIWDTLMRIIEEVRDGSRAFPPEAVKHTIAACMFGVMWSLHHVEETASHGVPDAAQLECLRSRLWAYMEVMQQLMSSHPNHVFREEAYISICDLLVVFSSQLASNTHLKPLVFFPDKNMQTQLNDFVQTYVFFDDDNDEQDEHAKIEDLHKRRNLLASFCKLVIYNVISIRSAADIFKHYVRYYNNYGDIIKAALGKAREINKVNCARTMMLSLQSVFTCLIQHPHAKVDRIGEEFLALKELAKRFALSFGLDALKNREGITSLHREGVRFALEGVEANREEMPAEGATMQSPPPPVNVAFLEVLSEFTNKLLKQDKRIVLNYLDRRLPAGVVAAACHNDEWQPVLMYRNSLMQGDSEPLPPPSRRAYTRRRKEEDPLPRERSPTRRSGRHRPATKFFGEVDDGDEDVE